MGEAGILSVEDRVELLAGEIVEMSAIGPLHASMVERLNDFFATHLAGRVIVRTQNPLLLRREDSEPQPDSALLRRRSDFYRDAHPEATDVFLAIEVADTSVDKDRDIKLPLYARAGISEAWLLDVAAERLDVYRSPTADGYQEVRLLRRGEAVTVQACPDLRLTGDDLLG